MTGPPWARIQKYTSNAMLYMPKVLRAPWARKNRLGRCVLAYVLAYVYSLYLYVLCLIVLNIPGDFYGYRNRVFYIPGDFLKLS